MPALAFDINGSKWPGGETDVYADLNGISNSGVPWQTALESAITTWNMNTDFNFVLRRQAYNPCLNDGINAIAFAQEFCGSGFGSNTIAVTLRDWEEAIIGPPDLIRTDIVINQNKSLDVYDGPIIPTVPGSSTSVIDFQRVMLHELGHALGLDHENDTVAIMNSSINDNFRLRQDDIDGANTLYRGLSNCHVADVSFGRVHDALSTGDCTVEKLMVGGNDDSFIDVRRLRLEQATSLTLDMRATALDSVIMIADAGLRVFAIDDNNGGNCDARLTRQLPAGTYYLLANTYSESSECGEINGDYTLNISYSDSGLRSLGVSTSLAGGNAQAGFFGSISADDGISFGNQFLASDSLDIMGRIEIDPNHQGQAGFVVIAARIGNTFLVKHNDGQFLQYLPESGPPPAAINKILEAVEQVEIANDLVPMELDVSDIQVDFYIGYGLASDPQELYFHGDPINLIVSPASDQ